MLKFHVFVQGSEGTRGSPLHVTFEEAYQALETLARMFIEPDGSFVWRGKADEGQEWQVDGNLVDQGTVLAHVEFKGCCPEKEMAALLAAVGWPEAVLLFQLPERGVFVEEVEFRRMARSAAGAY